MNITIYKCIYKSASLINYFQNDLNLNESNSIVSIPSVNTQTSGSMSVNKYNFKKDQTPLTCCASRLLQFLFLELKDELKEFVPKGNYGNIQQNKMFNIILI